MKTLTKLFILVFLSIVLIVQYSCDSQSRGFALPQGDIEAGKKAFVELSCNDCHSVNDIKKTRSMEGEDIHVPLGGEVKSIKTYGELVTSVINPSHKIAAKYRKDLTTAGGESVMRRYNDVMTVQDLVDLVTFLQEEYEVIPPEMDHYYY